jgi:hypothetical protein
MSPARNKTGYFINAPVNQAIKNSTGGTVLASPEAYTIPLPCSLDESTAGEPYTFYVTSSRPSVLTRIDKGQQEELLNCIANNLSRDFKIPLDIRSSSVNVTANQGGVVKEPVTRLILIGASNLQRTTAHFTSLGYEVLSYCTPGWLATPSNVAALLQKLESLPVGRETALVLDLFGNSTCRFVQFDGSSSLPIKTGGGYHLLGDVVVCNEANFDKIVDILNPLLTVLPGLLRIIVPPQPRYIFNGCCNEPTHSTNVGEPSHSEKLLSSLISLRARLKKTLASKIDKTFWLADSCCQVGEAAATPVAAKLAKLRTLCHPDGVHFTPEGDRNSAKNIASYVNALNDGSRKTTAASLFSGKNSVHFWRGFSSPIGSRRMVATRIAATSSLKAPRHKLPYGSNQYPYLGRGQGGRGSKRKN